MKAKGKHRYMGPDVLHTQNAKVGQCLKGWRSPSSECLLENQLPGFDLASYAVHLPPYPEWQTGWRLDLPEANIPSQGQSSLPLGKVSRCFKYRIQSTKLVATQALMPQRCLMTVGSRPKVHEVRAYLDRRPIALAACSPVCQLGLGNLCRRFCSCEQWPGNAAAATPIRGCFRAPVLAQNSGRNMVDQKHFAVVG